MGGPDIEIAYQKYVNTLTSRYNSLIDANFYSELMKDVCQRHKGLCTFDAVLDTVVGTPFLQDRAKQTKAAQREKRFFGMLGSLLGLGSLGLGSLNTWQISRMKTNMNKVEDQLKQTRHTVNVLREGTEILNHKVDAIQTFFHDEISYLFKVMERLRCQAQDTITHMEKEITLMRYQDYLKTNVEAAIQAALTGRLTPQVLAPEQLHKLFHAQVDHRLTLLANEPSLAYQFGRVYPVKAELDTMTFAYLLEFPLLTKREISPVFKVFNVGFHQALPGTSIILYKTLYRAPLPNHFISRADGELVPLRVELCERHPGILY